jgi:hypothetical protein
MSLYNVAIPARLGISPSPPLSKQEEMSTGIRLPNDSNHDAGLHRYSSDRPRSPEMPHRNNQKGISFSASDSSLLRHEPFSARYNNALMPSSSHSSTDYYLPPDIKFSAQVILNVDTVATLPLCEESRIRMTSRCCSDSAVSRGIDVFH